jgi:predicted DsbA family dithiol-disulfide isomerase
MAQSMITIDVVSDVICPWCFLGKRRLDKALSLIPDVKVEVVYRPFFLDPTIPADGLDRQQYMESKFGPERLKTIHDPLIAAGKEDGVPYHFDKITRTPNTLDAHRLIRWALPAGKQAEMKEALFKAYWSDGKDVGNHETLADIAASVGMDRKTILNDLASDKDKPEVLAETQQAQQMGITGVPTFIINHKYGISGAQSAEMLADAIKKVATQAN